MTGVRRFVPEPFRNASFRTRRFWHLALGSRLVLMLGGVNVRVEAYGYG